MANDRKSWSQPVQTSGCWRSAVVQSQILRVEESHMAFMRRSRPIESMNLNNIQNQYGGLRFGK